MNLIVGLGNPGERYKNNRHNVGQLVIDEIKKKKNLGLKAAKSDKFMNDSGTFVSKKIKKLKTDPRDLYVVHDDLDIKLGEYKIQFGKGPRDHNGLKSIDKELGTDQYWHIRVGVDNRDLENRTKGEDYVLQDFSEDEKSILEETIKTLLFDFNKNYLNKN